MRYEAVSIEGANMSRKKLDFEPGADLGRFLQEARLVVGLTQGEVARRLGLGSAQSVSDWEGNRSGSVPLDSLRKLVGLYNLDVERLFEVLDAYQFELHTQKMREVRSQLMIKKSVGK